MALDAHMIQAGGEPQGHRFADIGVEDHAALFAQIGDASRYPLLSRMRDYYADAAYEPNELIPLAAEAEAAESRFAVGDPARIFLGALRSQCVAASQEKARIMLYAD